MAPGRFATTIKWPREGPAGGDGLHLDSQGFISLPSETCTHVHGSLLRSWLDLHIDWMLPFWLRFFWKMASTGGLNCNIAALV